MHLHHPHLSPIGPHLDLRALRHDALVAAEVAMVAVALGVTIDRAASALAGHHDAVTSTPTSAATAPAFGAPVQADVPTLRLLVDASGATARVHLPAGATGRVDVLDAAGVPVAGAVPAETGAELRGLAAGTYTVVLHEEGPVERFGDAAVSSATVLRSRAFVVRADATVRVVVDR